MAGHLDEFWPDVRDSAWIGGAGDGWERGPYWLDGIIPLAFLLDDAGLKAKARRWVDYIIEHQDEDGWMGPSDGDPSDAHFDGYGTQDTWPRMVVLKALLQYFSAEGDERIIPAALRLVHRIDELLTEHPLHEWGRVRWADLVLSIDTLYELTGDAALLDIAVRVKSQGYDWEKYANSLPYRDKVSDARLQEYEREASGIWMNDDFLATHGANVAMGVKTLPVWWMNTGEAKLKSSFRSMLDQLDRYHGQATGLFTSDEHLAGRNPSQGTETCTVVEYMFSLETALEVWGADEQVVDRLERIAFNALPASARWDEWAHQYDQQANQVVCHVTDDRLYTNNGPDANVFGLEPHFGCCTANRHQGWPKFAARLWLQSSDGGLTALSYAPCQIDTKLEGNRIHIEVSGNYPFDDDVTITVSASEARPVPLRFRIPAWAVDATATVDGNEPQPLQPGSAWTVEREWSGRHVIQLSWTADVRQRVGFNDAITLMRGPLVFSAAVEEDWRQIGGELPHSSWEVHPASRWNVGLVPDETGAVPSRLTRRPIGSEPFTPDGSPLVLEAAGAFVSGWTLEHGAAAAPPESPADLEGPIETIRLLPYGAARLRVTELPLIAQAANPEE
jgi:DUF1680 family protein